MIPGLAVMTVFLAQGQARLDARPLELSATPVEVNGQIVLFRARITNTSKKSLSIFAPDDLTSSVFVLNDRPDIWETEFVCGMEFLGRNPELLTLRPGASLSYEVPIPASLKIGRYQIGVRYTNDYDRSLGKGPIKKPIRMELKSGTFPFEVVRPGEVEPQSIISIEVVNRPRKPR